MSLPPFLSRAALIRNLDLPPTWKLVLHTLNSRADRSGCCFPSLDQISIDSGLARSTVASILKSLRARGLVLCSRSGSRRHRNVYTLNLGSTCAPVLPDAVHQSGSRSRTSPDPEPTSPADGLVTVLPSETSLFTKSSVKEAMRRSGFVSYIDEEVIEAWLFILSRLKDIVPRKTLLTWFSDVIPISLTPDNFVVCTSIHPFLVEYIRSHFSSLLTLNCFSVCFPDELENVLV